MPLDLLKRRLGSLRISVTDRCNLRCEYCMPEENYVWLPRHDILSYEEIARLVGVFRTLGVDEVHLTGGEPLVRRDLPTLVRLLAPEVPDVALTTNGVLLSEMAPSLRAAGLQRVTVSLDTLRAERFREMTRRDRLGDVFDGLDAARLAGFSPLKINTVVTRGRNEDEIPDLVAYARELGAEIRFIEYMDVGGATAWSPERVFPKAEILEVIASRFGDVAPVHSDPSSPARRWTLPDGTTFGIIASTTSPFCRSCDRARLTADGMLLMCLYASRGTDLRAPLRDGASDAELARIVEAAWTNRADRGAEERLLMLERRALAKAETLRANPHLEMHTRGG
ncbi:MAG TPA: GTP 3',8-cyclase MoaA [Anaeromyxobacteraceae bacterium]|nr:GTP 3',8-cyclase MoaA [Anaeromyxobacteraceae bacterium]